MNEKPVFDDADIGGIIVMVERSMNVNFCIDNDSFYFCSQCECVVARTYGEVEHASNCAGVAFMRRMYGNEYKVRVIA